MAATPLNYTDGLTVIDAIKALDGVCDHATSKDGMGFSKFDREEHEDLIEKAISENHLSPKEETIAYRILKRYKKQLKGLGINCDGIGHIPRPDDSNGNEDETNSQEQINDRIPEWIEKFHFKTVTDTERLYRYDHGVYLDDGEIVLKTLIEAEFGDITDDRLVKDVIGKVKISRTRPPSGTSPVVMITVLRRSIIRPSISGTKPSSCFRPMCCPGALMIPMLTILGGFSSNF